MTDLRLRFLLLSLVITLVTGCAAAVVGGAATGASVVHDRRTTGSVIEDQEIYLRSLKILYDHPEIRAKSNISITSYNQQILLTGQTATAEVSQQLAGLVSRLPRVRHIYNEVTVGAEETWSDSAADSYLTSRIKIALFNVGLDSFDPTRVKVISSQGTAYLMGLLTRQEADAVTNEVRYISGVKRVVKLFEYINAN